MNRPLQKNSTKIELNTPSTRNNLLPFSKQQNILFHFGFTCFKKPSKVMSKTCSNEYTDKIVLMEVEREEGQERESHPPHKKREKKEKRYMGLLGLEPRTYRSSV